MSEPENLVLQHLRILREDMREGLDRMDKKIDNLGADLRSEMHSLRADVASDLMTTGSRLTELEKRLNDQFVGLRRAVMEYHSSAVGHGLLLSEFDERLRIVEERLEITRPESH